ncbi:MAG TPA: trypsin-like peptidase domain-containing protein [Solirubrobacteraceae bacterium]|jgi:S1-C subfamily serine protease|nr:trypsin-like peptidase domain-containing protein [Solirubrobacteraceae bacterium]
MRRTFLIPFISALVGGGVVVAVVAAAGDLGKRERSVTTVQAAPIAPSNASQQNQGLTPHDIYVKDAPGVAFVTSTIVQKTESPFNLFGGGETQRQGQATGSGIVIDNNGTILTNYHVVENAIKVTVSFEKGKTVNAQVVGKDPSNDLAILRIQPDGLTLHPLTLGNSEGVQVGDPVLAIGNPFDLERTLTTGVISALQRQITAPNGFAIDNVLQTDAPINPGNSGGPLLDASGRVIGINSQIETGGSGGGSIGIGFAVPIDTAKSEISQLEKGGTVRGAYIGLTSLTIDGSLSALNLPVQSGALVQSVQKGTPAEKAGIRGGTVNGSVENGQVAVGGDIIVSIDGKAVNSSEDLANDVSAKKSGDTVTVGLLRANGKGGYEHKNVSVTLASRPNSVPNPSTPEG